MEYVFHSVGLVHIGDGDFKYLLLSQEEASLVSAVLHIVAAYFLFGVTSHRILVNSARFRYDVVDTEPVSSLLSTILFGESNEKGVQLLCMIVSQELRLKRLKFEA